MNFACDVVIPCSSKQTKAIKKISKIIAMWLTDLKPSLCVDRIIRLFKISSNSPISSNIQNPK